MRGSSCDARTAAAAAHPRHSQPHTPQRDRVAGRGCGTVDFQGQTRGTHHGLNISGSHKSCFLRVRHRDAPPLQRAKGRTPAHTVHVATFRPICSAVAQWAWVAVRPRARSSHRRTRAPHRCSLPCCPSPCCPGWVRVRAGVRASQQDDSRTTWSGYRLAA